MTNTPIHRIPREPGVDLAMMVNYEVKNFAIPLDLATVLSELIDPVADDQGHYTTVLDWAMQLRSELGIDWSTAIRVASILYFG